MEKLQTEKISNEFGGKLVSKNQRYIYAFLFFVPSIFISIFIYGLSLFLIIIMTINNNESFAFNYPFNLSLAEILYIIPMIVIFFGTKLGYSVGKKHDIENISINRNHIILSIVVTLVLLFIFLSFRDNL